tara:strand:- start:71 stop:874 length:804 start_codon:yes stop_codon:yes gene_type:complete
MAFVIAEIGVNHQGDVDLAENYIRCAERCGADAVKFQLYDAEKIEPPGERRDMLQKLALNDREMLTLKRSADNCGIEFMCTPFDVWSLEYLVEVLKVKKMKISSGDIDNIPLLEAAASHEKNVPVILSTGMATNDTIRKVLEILKAPVVLHCISAYPCPLEDVNLNMMSSLHMMHGVQVGLSDHSLSTVVPAAAVAMGAVVIEKHLTFSRDDPGPDHEASLQPLEFRDMVDWVRHIEVAMGRPVRKRPLPVELETVGLLEGRMEMRA